MILSARQKVSISMVGTDGNLSIVGSFQIIQDAVTELAGMLKIDGGTLRDKYNALWVFTKTRAKFFKKIGWNKELAITSYISFISNAKIHINVVLKDDYGEVVLFSKTEMCALDIETQRIRKTSSVGVEQSMLERANDTIDIAFTKFAEVELPTVEQVIVKSTNIDFSRHTNNTEYIRLVMDTYSVEEMENKVIKEFEILYANQSFEKDILDIRKANVDNKDLVLIEKNGQAVAKCEIVF
ncbi:MAG: hypothetical protein K2M75_00365 [Clostridia bacterium]|nr:hypothetical protein [Clostridia bacterium]